jgi:single-strand DNA-binding protein
MQKFIAVGNLGKDPEIRFLPGGQSVVNFSIATSRRWKDKDTGEKKEDTEWHNCEAWGKLAEIISGYLKKGSKIYIEGRLKTTPYEKDGHKFYPTKIIVEEMEMLDSKDKSSDTAAQYQPAPPQQAYAPAPPPPQRQPPANAVLGADGAS